MRLCALLWMTTASLVAAQTPEAARGEVDNAAAFARLYGVVRYFYPSDAAASLDWNRFALHGVARVRAARGLPQLEATLEELFTPLGPGISIDASLPAPPQTGATDAALVAWRYRGPGFAPVAKASPYAGVRTNRSVPASFIADAPVADAHVDVELIPGLQARVALSLTDAEARVESTFLPALRAALSAVLLTPASSDTDVRLSDVVVAWNVFRHFYPYWVEADVDWDARLRPHLQRAYDAMSSREAHRTALRALVADVRDGHALVVDSARPRPGLLPLQFAVVENRVVISAAADQRLAIGDVVVALDGEPATKRLATEMELFSGTTQWKRSRALRDLATCPDATSRTLRLEGSSGARDVTVTCTASQATPEKRPGPIAELTTGVWYVDLTRATMEQVRPELEKLANATALVFDVRGYPTDAGLQVLPHLIDAPETDRWMHVGNITGPFGRISGWNSFGWNLKPATPPLPRNRVFLTDGRAISYAESVMGYVADRKLATIVGAATAGANGNVVSFEVPGGFTIPFTGMRVTRHDGRSTHHLVGVQPDIPLEPTLAGLRGGRDELLERALAIVRKLP